MDTDTFNALIGINATSLLSRNTPVGEYTRNLIAELQKMLPNQPLLFHGNAWSNKTLTNQLSPIASLKALFKNIPYAHQLSHLMQQRPFSKGAHTQKINLYHEPNFVSHPFSGPTIITIHDLAYIRHPGSYSKDKTKHLQRHVSNSIATAQHILVSSTFVKGEVMAYYDVSPHKITVTHPGINIIFRPFSAVECQSILKLYQLTYGNYILASDTFAPHKNIKTVLNAFLSLEETSRRYFPLIIVGMPKHQIRILIRESRIRKNEIIFLNDIPPAHLPILYSGAKLFAYPSLYEGFPTSALEAIACGTPVLASTTSSLPEVIGDAGILIRPDDVDNWAYWIQMMLENKKMHEEYCQSGPKHASLFSWERCARQTVQVYRNTLK